MNHSEEQFMPGLPVKRRSPLFDPEQSFIPHLVLNIPIRVDENGNQYVGDAFYTPSLEYFEYDILLEPYADKMSKKLNKKIIK